MKQVPVKNNQTLFDIACQEYGDVTAVFDLVELNGFDSPVDNLNAGQMINIGEPKNKAIKDYLEQYEVVSGTDDSRAEGIGFWLIEDDFIVT